MGLINENIYLNLIFDFYRFGIKFKICLFSMLIYSFIQYAKMLSLQINSNVKIILNFNFIFVCGMSYEIISMALFNKNKS